MPKKPKIDKHMCTSCGLCTELAPHTIKLDEDDLAEVYNPTGDPEDAIQEAIDSCPVEAISWEEA